MREKHTLWGFFAHAGIIVGMMFVVFFAIDRFNPAMEFLTSGLSKWLILFLAVCAVGDGLFSAVLLFQRQKRREERSQARAASNKQLRAYVPQKRAEREYEDPRVRKPAENYKKSW